MEIPVHHEGNDGKIYECAFCHKKYNTPIERATCEQKCYANKQHEEQTKKLELDKLLAQRDTERITKEYDQFVSDVKHHVNTYGEMVRVHNHCFSRNIDRDLSMLELTHIPFWI